MAINTSALTLTSAAPAKGAFKTRQGGSGSSQVASDPHQDNDSTIQASGGAPAASQNNGTDSPVQTGGTPQKATGPSLQTRSNARTSRAATPKVPSAAASATEVAAAAAAVDEASDFGSVMASALGRSATTTDPTATTQDATLPTEPGSASARPAAGSPADAMAWFAQVLMPSTGAPPTAPAVTSDTSTLDLSVAGAGAASTAVASSAAALLPVLPALTAGTARTRLGPPLPASAADSAAAPTQAPETPATQSATNPAANTAADLTAMADAQKLIAGMTATNATPAADDSGSDASATPVAHAASSSAATDATQSAAALQASGLTRTENTLGAVTLSIQSPVGSSAFANEVSTRISSLAQSGVTQAQLQLSPADLGPVQVHITVQSGQASVWFGANHADTRAALEQSLPRLRELFAGAGMPLTDSGVFREPPQPQHSPSVPSALSANGHTETLSAPTVTQVANVRLSLLDTYA